MLGLVKMRLNPVEACPPCLRDHSEQQDQDQESNSKMSKCVVVTVDNNKDGGADQTICRLNPAQPVLYSCVGLVEEIIKDY